MQFDSLINPDDLYIHLNQPDWVIIDCHFELDDTEAGRRAYKQEHIPRAIYAHLDEDLSGKIVPGKTGRHPLPEVNVLVRTFSEWGIDDKVQVVVYDKSGGAIAARLWWMLKWMGHNSVALLNGGLSAWKEAGYPVERSISVPSPRTFHPKINSEMIARMDVMENYHEASLLLVDSRAPERYRGEGETIDPVAGHIPGALNVYCMDNLDLSQIFLPKEELQERFSDLIREHPPEEIVFYCGSGVTATHNILAMYHAGLGMAKLYPGSWSEWITDPNRPIETK